MERAAVEPRHPPRWLVRVLNPVVRRLAARGIAAEQILVLHLTGRRTGRLLDVPVGYHLLDGVPTVFTNSTWRHNLAGGRDVEVTFRGRRRPARAELVRDVGEVTDAYTDLITRLGWRAAQRRLGIRIPVRRQPTGAEVAGSVARSGLSLVRLTGLLGDEEATTRPDDRSRR